MKHSARTMFFIFVLLCFATIVCVAADELADNTASRKTLVQLKPEKKAPPAEKIQAERETPATAEQEIEFEQLNLPEDTSSKFTVKELRISGNTLVSTDELLKNMPLVYNVSDKSLTQAEPGDLYDFRILHDIIQHPGQPGEVSRRTMQGFTQYLLSVYQEHDYAGIYVYIPAHTVEGGVEFEDGILLIEVVEGKVSEIVVTSYNTEQEKVEKGLLRSSVIEAWSPVKKGQVVNKKELDKFINLLNLNPDRYISAVISRGSEPDTLALGYDIYEANPWHYYIQLDNSGSKERQWAPRIGVMNTNLTGIDDRISAMYQASLDSIEDNYLGYGSYDFPLLSPRLRLNLYGGHNKFDVSGGGGIDFLGRGTFYGGILRLNAFQTNGWFFDVASSLSHENSQVTPSLFRTLETDIDMDLWGIGAQLHRSDDMSNTSFAFNYIQDVGGSSKDEFVKARLGTGPDFDIYTVSAARSQYLDTKKIQQLSGSLRWITSNKRLAPSKMTTFGGLYSVRGYKENEIVADGGLLLSAQYEFDLVKYSEAKENNQNDSTETVKKPWLRKLALLTFIDYGRAKIKSPVPGENGIQELCSIGVGTTVRLGDNFDANIYYGYPLRSTTDTREGRGRWSFNFIRRW
jgi:hemolysin activation/secretion protein